MSKTSKAVKILSTTFWIVMAIHVIIFTIIGFTTGSWFFLTIFIPSVIVIMLVKWLLTRYAERHPNKKWTSRWLKYTNKRDSTKQ